MTPTPPFWAYLALAASMSLVGSYVALSKALLLVFPVFVLAWWRFLIAATAMLHWLRVPPDASRLSWRDHGQLAAQSLFGNFLFSICMLFGMRHTSASEAGLIMAALPAVVGLLSALLLRERLQRSAVLAIGLAFAGMVIYAADQPHATSSQAWWGKALMLGAVLCEAMYVVIGKSLSTRVSPRRVSALINLWGLTFMTPLALWTWSTWSAEAVTLDLWGLMVFYALAASVWTVWLWMKGLQHVPAHRAGVFTVMLPISAASVGVLFLDERLSVTQWLALGLALAGVIVSTRSGGHLTKQA